MVNLVRLIRSRAVLAALVVALLATLGLLADEAFWREPRSLALAYVQVTTPAWPAGTAPLRVALISDLHVDHAHMPPERVKRLVQTVNALSPDLIVLAGDYVGGLWDEGGSHKPRAQRSAQSNALIEQGLGALAGLKARYGAVAVIGNHDGYWDPDRVAAGLQADGITVLQNASLRIARPGGDVWVVGLEDAQTQHPDFARALQGVPARAAVLGVGHNPGLIDWRSDTLPVLLAGHTHGGQVRFPWVGAVARLSRYINSTANQPVIRHGRVLVVTRGLGESGLPVRFGSPPEIMLVEIAPGSQASGRRLS